jgi:hypothetical protein
MKMKWEFSYLALLLIGVFACTHTFCEERARESESSSQGQHAAALSQTATNTKQIGLSVTSLEGFPRDFKQAFLNTFSEQSFALQRNAAKEAASRSFGGAAPSEQPLEPIETVDGGKAYVPSAGGAETQAIGSDLLSLDCDFTHVLTALHQPHSGFSISTESQNPDRPKLVRDESKDRHVDDRSTYCHLAINPQLVRNLAGKEGGTQLPVLSDKEFTWFPESICVADNSGKCVADAPKGVSLKNTNRFFSTLEITAEAKANLGDKMLIVKYAPASGGVDQRASLSFNRTLSRGTRLSSDLNLSHPGDNSKVRSFINQALKESMKSSSNMHSFLENHRIGDCDMVALANAQFDRSEGRNGLIAVGNRPLSPRVVDSQTTNHAWNYSDGRIYDATPSAIPTLEYFADEGNLKWMNHNFATWTYIDEQFPEKPWSQQSDIKYIPRVDVEHKALEHSPFSKELQGTPVIPEFSIITRYGASEASHGSHGGNIPIPLRHDRFYMRDTSPVVRNENSKGEISAPADYTQFRWVDSQLINGLRPTKGKSLSDCFQPDVQELVEKIQNENCRKETPGSHKYAVLKDRNGRVTFARGDDYKTPKLQDAQSSIGEDLPELTLQVGCFGENYTKTYTRADLMRICESRNVNLEPVKIVRGSVVVD